MAPKVMQFIHKLFRTNWKRQIEYDRSFHKRKRKSACVLKSVSSKSSLSQGSGCSLANQHAACSIDSINFEFSQANNTGNLDLCCVRKCCEKCFCEEGEAIAEGVRKGRSKKRLRMNKAFFTKCQEIDPSAQHCNCISRCSISASRGSMDSACDVSSNSSCQDDDCTYRYSYDADASRGVPVHTFANIHASAIASDIAEYNTLTPQYENIVVDAETKANPQGPSVEPIYDSVPPRPPRAVSEPSYENVLSVNCIDNCVFRQISSLLDKSQSTAQMVQSLQHLHKDYSCVDRSASADNEINYYYENYAEYENDLNNELERRLSD